MTDNPNKKSLWDKIHIDPAMLLILLALLVYSALVIWSASGQDVGMMERKIGQIAMGLVIMVVMAQIPPRVYEGWAPYLYIICIILLVAVDAFGAISKGAQRWLDLGIVRFQPSEIAKIAVPLMVARFINRDVCPPSLKNTGIALVLGIFSVMQWEFSLPVLAAVLAVLGYSVNESVIIFDRVREHFRTMRRADTMEVINSAITATISRTVITHTSTLCMTLSMFFFGGPALHYFSLALTIGILLGVYSSVFVAAAIALYLGVKREDLVRPVKKDEVEEMVP